MLDKHVINYVYVIYLPKSIDQRIHTQIESKYSLFSMSTIFIFSHIQSLITMHHNLNKTISKLKTKLNV